jgi:carbon monoxide dehydrogenase subunit G
MGKKAVVAFLAALVVSVVTAATAFAASEFEGTWTVQGVKDQTFDITLSGDGKATSTLPKSPTGTWKEEGGAAVVKWDSGWITKITKQGDKYIKQAVKPDGSPGKTSEATKKQ